jgi:hypothetical protein
VIRATKEKKIDEDDLIDSLAKLRPANTFQVR